MRKKSLVVCAMAMVMMLGVTGCGNKEADKKDNDKKTEVTTEANSEEKTDASTEETSTEGTTSDSATNNDANDSETATGALSILEKVWGQYADDEKFMAMGGDAEAMVMDGPGSYNLADKEGITAMFHIPADKLDMVDDVASIVHGMNTNSFTGSVSHVKNADEVSTLADAMKADIDGTQWICGAPQKLLIAGIGDNVVCAFGDTDLLDTFKTKLQTAYPDVNVIHDTDIVIEF